MDRRNICVFDFETGGKNPHVCEVIQIGALILNRNNFKTMSTFESLMKPKDFDTLEDEALEKNGITKEELENAPEAKVVFPSFCEWIKKFNIARDKSFYGAPIPCGYNINGFDLILFDRYCKEYKYWDEKQDRQNVMFPLNRLDVFDHMWLFLRTNSEIKRTRLTSLLEYAGVEKEEITKGAHNALWDVKMTAEFAVKLLKLAKHLTDVDPNTGKSLLNIKNCLVGVTHTEEEASCGSS